MYVPSKRFCFQILENPAYECEEHHGDFSKDCSVCIDLQEGDRKIIGWACHVCRLPVWGSRAETCPRCGHVECFLPGYIKPKKHFFKMYRSR